MTGQPVVSRSATSRVSFPTESGDGAGRARRRPRRPRRASCSASSARPARASRSPSSRVDGPAAEVGDDRPARSKVARPGAARRATKEHAQALRGKRIAMIFQDPLSALNPVHKVGRQIVEMIRSHQDISQRGGVGAGRRAARPGRHPAAEDPGAGSTRTSSPAACASG